MTAELRYATEADLSTFVDVFRRVVEPLEIYCESARIGEIEKFCAEELRRRLHHDECALTLAFVDSEPAGFSITDDQHGPIWIEWYGVVPDKRQLGIGRQLVQRLLNEAPNRKATKLWCDTRVNNHPSIALFKSLGFTKLCDLPNHWYGQDFYLWQRPL